MVYLISTLGDVYYQTELDKYNVYTTVPLLSSNKPRVKVRNYNTLHVAFEVECHDTKCCMTKKIPVPIYKLHVKENLIHINCSLLIQQLQLHYLDQS